MYVKKGFTYLCLITGACVIGTLKEVAGAVTFTCVTIQVGLKGVWIDHTFVED